MLAPRKCDRVSQRAEPCDHLFQISPPHRCFLFYDNCTSDSIIHWTRPSFLTSRPSLHARQVPRRLGACATRLISDKSLSAPPDHRRAHIIPPLESRAAQQRHLLLLKPHSFPVCVLMFPFFCAIPNGAGSFKVLSPVISRTRGCARERACRTEHGAFQPWCHDNAWSKSTGKTYEKTRLVHARLKHCSISAMGPSSQTSTAINMYCLRQRLLVASCAAAAKALSCTDIYIYSMCRACDICPPAHIANSSSQY